MLNETHCNYVAYRIILNLEYPAGALVIVIVSRPIWCLHD